MWELHCNLQNISEYEVYDNLKVPIIRLAFRGENMMIDTDIASLQTSFFGGIC